MLNKSLENSCPTRPTLHVVVSIVHVVALSVLFDSAVVTLGCISKHAISSHSYNQYLQDYKNTRPLGYLDYLTKPSPALNRRSPGGDCTTCTLATCLAPCFGLHQVAWTLSPGSIYQFILNHSLGTFHINRRAAELWCSTTNSFIFTKRE